MKKLLTNLPLLILLILGVLFVVANRGTVTVSLWPLPYEIDLGLYLVFFIGLFAGIGLTLVIVTVKRARGLVRARRAEKETRRLQKEVDGLEQELDAGGATVTAATDATGAGEAGEKEAEGQVPRLPPDVG